jgi:hypothetical protein
MGREVEVIVSFGGLHEKHAVQRGVLGTNSAFGTQNSTLAVFGLKLH